MRKQLKLRMEASFISEKGIRPGMEDAHYLDLDFGGKGWVYGGVYDGHNGVYAAKYTAEYLHKVFLEKLASGVEPERSFVESYEEVSERLNKQESGTAAVDFLIKDGQVITANAGDARAIIVSKRGFRQLTTDHRLDNDDEKERVLRTGASIRHPYVVKGNQGLMTTRAIGDEYFKSVGVIATPSLYSHLLSMDDLVLVSACDGLWDFMSNEEVAVLARQYRVPDKLMQVLNYEVLVNRLGTDNLTIIAVSLS